MLDSYLSNLYLSSKVQSISDCYSKLGDASLNTDIYLDDIFLILIFEFSFEIIFRVYISLIWILLP